MSKINFPTLWQKWIMKCVTTTSASVLVNIGPVDEFKFQRELHQGDLISPILYLLVVKGINVLMNSAMEVGLFTSYSFGCSYNISVSHLQLTNDNLLLGDKNWTNVRSLKVNFNKIM